MEPLCGGVVLLRQRPCQLPRFDAVGHLVHGHGSELHPALEFRAVALAGQLPLLVLRRGEPPFVRVAVQPGSMGVCVRACVCACACVVGGNVSAGDPRSPPPDKVDSWAISEKCRSTRAGGKGGGKGGGGGGKGLTAGTLFERAGGPGEPVTLRQAARMPHRQRPRLARSQSSR